MKKVILSIVIVLALTTGVWAAPWITVTGIPGGSSGDVQCNNSGVFGACTNLSDVAPVQISGTPALNYWAVWYNANTMKSVAVTGSKVVCTDGSGLPTACTNLTDTAVSGSMASDALWDAAGDTVYGTGSNTGARLAKGSAYQVYMMNSGATAPSWSSTLGATGTRLTKGWFTDLEITNAPTVNGAAWTTILQPLDADLTRLAGMTVDATANTLGITAGTAVLNVAPSTTLNVDTNLTVQTGAVTLTGNAAGSTLVLPAGSLTLPVPTAAGQIPIASGAGVFAISTYKYPTTVPTANYILSSDGTDIVGSNTLQIGTLNIPSSTASPGTTAGQLKHDSDATNANSGGDLQWYDGAQVRSVVDTGTNYTKIVKTEFLPIKYAEDGSTAPSAAAAVTGKVIIARSFTEGDDVVFFWSVPNDYIGGGKVKYRVHYALSTAGAADDTVKYSMTGCIIADSADIACSAGTALTITDELADTYAQYEYAVTAYSAESNADWGAAAGGLVKLAFSYADEDYNHEVLVIGIEIKYLAKVMSTADY